MIFTWDQVRRVLLEAELLVISDLVVGDIVVYADNSKDDCIALVTQHGEELYCLVHERDNQTVEIAGHSMWLTAHDGGDPIQITAYRPRHIEEEPTLTNTTETNGQ